MQVFITLPIPSGAITGMQFLSVQDAPLTVYGNGIVDILSGNDNTSITLGENSSGAGIVDFKANARIGETNLGGSISKISFSRQM